MEHAHDEEVVPRLPRALARLSASFPLTSDHHRMSSTMLLRDSPSDLPTSKKDLRFVVLGMTPQVFNVFNDYLG